MPTRTLPCTRLYVTAGRDRHGLLFGEAGRAEHVSRLDDGTRVPLCNGWSPFARFTLGWPVDAYWHREGHYLDAGIWRIWFEGRVPRRRRDP